MNVFRIEREEHLETTLTGIGVALSEGNRWNGLQTFLVYTAQSRALATLEVAVHLDVSEDLPTDRNYVEIDIPDEIDIIELSNDELPDNWDDKPPSLETQYIGDDFVKTKEAAVLKVPSGIVPGEFNYLINPSHTDSDKIKVISTQTLVFDNRLKQSI